MLRSATISDTHLRRVLQTLQASHKHALQETVDVAQTLRETLFQSAAEASDTVTTLQDIRAELQQDRWRSSNSRGLTSWLLGMGGQRIVVPHLSVMHTDSCPPVFSPLSLVATGPTTLLPIVKILGYALEVVLGLMGTIIYVAVSLSACLVHRIWSGRITSDTSESRPLFGSSFVRVPGVCYVVLFDWPTTNTGKCERRFLRRMQSLSRSSNPVLWLHKTPSHGSDVPITDSAYCIIDMLSCLGRRKPPQTHDESSLSHYLSIAHTITRITTNSSSPVDTLEECNSIDWHAERSLSRYEGDLVPVPSIHAFFVVFPRIVALGYPAVVLSVFFNHCMYLSRERGKL